MSPVIIVLGILLFAAVSALLLFWGMRKSYYQKETLVKILLAKSSEKVMHYLKDNPTVTAVQIQNMIEGIKASEFYSRKQAVVQNDKAFSMRLIEAMLHDGLIEPVMKGRHIYKKREKKSR